MDDPYRKLCWRLRSFGRLSKKNVKKVRCVKSSKSLLIEFIFGLKGRGLDRTVLGYIFEILTGQEVVKYRNGKDKVVVAIYKLALTGKNRL